eukprot:4947414-Prymnesium_polylepis.3
MLAVLPVRAEQLLLRSSTECAIACALHFRRTAMAGGVIRALRRAVRVIGLLRGLRGADDGRRVVLSREQRPRACCATRDRLRAACRRCVNRAASGPNVQSIIQMRQSVGRAP